MWLLQQIPPDTTGYMAAGYLVIFIVILVYIISLSIRWRNLQRDLQVLKELEEKQS